MRLVQQYNFICFSFSFLLFFVVDSKTCAYGLAEACKLFGRKTNRHFFSSPLLNLCCGSSIPPKIEIQVHFMMGWEKYLESSSFCSSFVYYNLS